VNIDIVEDLPLYILNYPNNEVKQALFNYLIEGFTNNGLDKIQPTIISIKRSLRRVDLSSFIDILRSLFANIPSVLHIEREAYYHSLFYMILSLMGLSIDLEVLTDKGRIDGVLTLDNLV